MRSLNLEDAAAFVGLHPNTLQARAKAGEIPGAKPGKEWRFLVFQRVAGRPYGENPPHYATIRPATPQSTPYPYGRMTISTRKHKPT